jgi:hypothetical protein
MFCARHVILPNVRRHCERSEAIQTVPAAATGLLRRFAPRNDGEICYWPSVAAS